MKLPKSLEKYQEIYLKHRETLSYLFWGVMTTLLNFVCFLICFYAFHFTATVSNVIAWIVAVIFAFFVNKIFVFRSKQWELKKVSYEFWTFIAGRLLSLGFETLFLYITVDLFHFEASIMKLIASVVVMIMNYITSKLFSFKKEKPQNADAETQGDTNGNK
ncbi:MAG: GtrA family protein [Lachnospiraceae bacterium]|nr:GtrA family protein [Lachnospiraceae bacterium]